MATVRKSRTRGTSPNFVTQSPVTTVVLVTVTAGLLCISTCKVAKYDGRLLNIPSTTEDPQESNRYRTTTDKSTTQALLPIDSTLKASTELSQKPAAFSIKSIGLNDECPGQQEEPLERGEHNEVKVVRVGNNSVRIANSWSLLRGEHCCRYRASCDNGVCGLEILLGQTFGNLHRRISAETIWDLLRGDHDRDKYRNIRALSLRRNRILSVDAKAFEYFDSVYELDLSENDLQDLDLSVVPLHNLTKLKVSFNKLSHFDSQPFNLISLHLDNNDLYELSFLSVFTKLKCIFLQNNKIKEIVGLPGLSKQICRIKLSQNYIQRVNVNMSKHNSLRILEFDSNNISFFNFLGLTKHLHHLNICNNRISRVSPTIVFRSMSYLKDLILCNNSINTPSFIIHADNVQCLILSNNNLKDMSGLFDRKKNLKTLKIANTNLNSLDFLHSVSSLNKLVVDGNNLKYIPPSIFRNEKLDELNISNNPLENLYCPVSEEEQNLIRRCEITDNNRIESETIIHLGMRNVTINTRMKCMLKTGRPILLKCTHKLNIAINRNHTNFHIMVFLLFMLVII